MPYERLLDFQDILYAPNSGYLGVEGTFSAPRHGRKLFIQIIPKASRAL